MYLTYSYTNDFLPLLKEQTSHCSYLKNDVTEVPSQTNSTNQATRETIKKKLKS